MIWVTEPKDTQFSGWGRELECLAKCWPGSGESQAGHPRCLDSGATFLSRCPREAAQVPRTVTHVQRMACSPQALVLGPLPSCGCPLNGNWQECVCRSHQNGQSETSPQQNSKHNPLPDAAQSGREAHLMALAPGGG